jgi:GTPase SAR1 family protein
MTTFTELSQQTTAKLVLLGEMGSGKSSLVLRYVKGQFFDYQARFPGPGGHVGAVGGAGRVAGRPQLAACAPCVVARSRPLIVCCMRWRPRARRRPLWVLPS